MVTCATVGKTYAHKHPSGWTVRHVKRGNPRPAFIGHLASVDLAISRMGRPREDAPEPESPRGLNLEETIWVLGNTPHEPYERPPEVLAQFERYWQRVDAEPPEDEDSEVIRDASTNLDKYIYG